MASWTTPKTYSGGSELTASELNTYQRDNQTFLKDTLTTHGMTSDSSVSHVKTDYVGVQPYRTANLTVTPSQWQLMPYADYDLSPQPADSISSHNLYARRAGNYDVAYTILVEQLSAGAMAARVVKFPGDTEVPSLWTTTGALYGVWYQTLHACSTVPMTTDEYLGLQLYTTVQVTVTHVTMSLLLHSE